MSTDNSIFFSVITPAYNAEKTIGRVFDSLNGQSFKSFEWIVVDDGSTDQTYSLIESFSAISSFPISLIRIENQHKKTAVRHGLLHARGLMTLIADADDDIPTRSLETMFECWQQIPDKINFSGVCGLCVDQRGEIVGNRFPASPLDCNSIEMRLRYAVDGEKWGCVLTSELLDVYPNLDHVNGHVPEGIYQRKLTRKKARFINEIVRVYYTGIEGSITNSAFNPSNAHGILLDAVDWLDNYNVYFKLNPVFFIKRAASYNKYHKYIPSDLKNSVTPNTLFAKFLIFFTFFARAL